MPGMYHGKVLRFLGSFSILASSLLLAQSPGKPTATATAEGAVTTKGLPDISVRLEKESTDPLSNFDGYLATVEGDGRFRFEDVAPGDYRLLGSFDFGMPEEAEMSEARTVAVKVAGGQDQAVELDLFELP